MTSGNPTTDLVVARGLLALAIERDDLASAVSICSTIRKVTKEAFRFQLENGELITHRDCFDFVQFQLARGVADYLRSQGVAEKTIGDVTASAIEKLNGHITGETT